MGKMNLLKANWEGKVGQTVGAKWKNLSTIRTYTKPAYTDTPAQQTIRTGFAEISKFTATFTGQLKGLSALDTKGQSIRNAILSINKAQITGGALDPLTLVVSKGGLPVLMTLGADFTAAPIVELTWTSPTSPIITSKAKVVVIVAMMDGSGGVVGEFPIAAGTGEVTLQGATANNSVVYGYILDYRGSSKVASNSIVSR